MSIQAISNPKLYQLDYLIQDKLEIILTNDTIHSKYPDYQNCGIFEDPLQLYKTKTLQNTEISRENTIETIRLLRQERSELVSVIKQLNEEKQELQRHNFELMEKLFVFENFNIEKFDHNFNQYLSRVIFLNYELSKKFLEMERENSEKMKESLIKKDDEILGLKSKITLLEQKVIESRKMLKKTILETPALATQGSNEIANMGSVNNLDFNKQFSTQQDTLNDSSMRTYDKNRNNYPRVGLLSPNQIEAPMSARLQNVNFDKLSGFGTEDTSFDEIDSKLNRGGGRTTKHSNMKTQDTSPSISGKKDQPKSMTKIGGSKNTLTVPRMSQQFPTTQLTSPKGTVTKGGLTKSSSQKTLELQSKSKLKSDTSSPKKDENLSLSFLLDQNISVDSSINFPTGIMSGAAARELEGEYKRKGNLKEASNTSKTETSNVSRGKVASTAMMSKTMSDPNKNKLKVPINTTPITVKKKSANEPK